MQILVCGAGGFIGGHLVRYLLNRGHNDVRAVDIKPLSEWWQLNPRADNIVADLRSQEACYIACSGRTHVYQLAARMGGIAEIETHRCACAMNTVLTACMLNAARIGGVERFFQSSSACVYHALRQTDPDVTALKEEDVEVYGGYSPEPGYGQEKLFGEQLCQFHYEDYGLETRVARFHNVYGPWGNWNDGKEKAPAAICRKVIEAKLSGKNEIEIWGDGTQTRSFMYIDDCLKGIEAITDWDVREPLNLGSAEVVTINQLVNIVEEIAGVKLERRYNLNAPQGVRGRNSDNTLFREHFGWEPSTPLWFGLKHVYAWIWERMR